MSEDGSFDVIQLVAHSNCQRWWDGLCFSFRVVLDCTVMYTTKGGIYPVSNVILGYNSCSS